MVTITQETRAELAGGEVVTIAKALGQTVVCESGELWITVGGDSRDIILRQTEIWRIDSDATLVVSAIRPSTVSVRQRPSFKSPSNNWWSAPLSQRPHSFPLVAAFPRQSNSPDIKRVAPDPSSASSPLARPTVRKSS